MSAQAAAKEDPVLAAILAAPLDEAPPTPDELEQVRQFERSKRLVEHQEVLAAIATRSDR